MDTIIFSDDINKDIPVYNPVTADYLANTKRGNVYIYFRKSLPLRILDIHFLHESINVEMRIGNKVFNFISLYRSQSQSLEEYETFTEFNDEFNWDTIAKNNPSLFVLLGNLNSKSSN